MGKIFFNDDFERASILSPIFGNIKSTETIVALAKFPNCMEMKISKSLSFLGKEIRRENIFYYFLIRKT